MSQIVEAKNILVSTLDIVSGVAESNRVEQT